MKTNTGVLHWQKWPWGFWWRYDLYVKKLSLLLDLVLTNQWCKANVRRRTIQNWPDTFSATNWTCSQGSLKVYRIFVDNAWRPWAVAPNINRFLEGPQRLEAAIKSWGQDPEFEHKPTAEKVFCSIFSSSVRYHFPFRRLKTVRRPVLTDSLWETFFHSRYSNDVPPARRASHLTISYTWYRSWLRYCAMREETRQKHNFPALETPVWGYRFLQYIMLLPVLRSTGNSIYSLCPVSMSL